MELERLARRPVQVSQEVYQHALRKLMVCMSSMMFLAICVILY